MRNTYIISLGGSLISTSDGIQVDFLRKFREAIINQIAVGKKFVIITGGGNMARESIKSASEVVQLNNDQKDMIGIAATRLNACIVRNVFLEFACDKLIHNPTDKIEFNKPVMMSGGWKPGHSTDYVAAYFAERFNIETILNLSNIDYVYTSDPRVDKEAKIIKQTSWADFQELVGTTWEPGLNAPFDPIASMKCGENSTRVVICHGKKISNWEKIFNNEEFEGTVIQ